jgi:hypothetical protein
VLKIICLACIFKSTGEKEGEGERKNEADFGFVEND